MSGEREPTADEKREMLAKAGFRSGGFKKPDEVTTHPSPAPSAEVTDGELAEAEMAADADAANDKAAAMDLSLPGAPAEGESPAPAAEDPSPAPPAAAAADEGEIRIGTRTFKTQKEAWAYAQELHEKEIANDAFRHGLEVAQGGEKSNAEEPKVTGFDPNNPPEDFWLNPGKYLVDWGNQIREQVRSESTMAEKSRATMTQFYKDYPDLVGDEDVVQMLIKSEWNTIKGLETKVGLKLVADKARNWLEEKTKKRMPTVELPKVRQTTSRGNGQNVTTKQPEAKPLNFIQQQKNLKTPKGRADAKKRLGL